MQKFNLKEEDNKWFFEEFWGGDTKDQELVDFIHSLKQNFTTALLVITSYSIHYTKLYEESPFCCTVLR